MTLPRLSDTMPMSDIRVRAVIRATNLVPSLSNAEAERIVNAVFELLKVESDDLRQIIDAAEGRE